MRSIRRKFILSYIILTAVTLTAVGSIYFTVIHTYTRSMERDHLLRSAGNITPHIREYLLDRRDRSSSARVLNAAAALGELEIRLLDREGVTLAEFTGAGTENMGALFEAIPPGAGRMLFEMYRPASRMPVPHMADRRGTAGMPHGVRINRELSGKDRIVLEIDRPEGVIFLELKSASKYLDTLSRWAAIGFFISAAAAMAASTLLGFFMGRRFSRPILDLAGTAGAMAAGNLSARSDIRRSDEIGLLSGQFNTMADTLQENFSALAEERDSLKTFLENASHEMRTPLTSLLTFNELLSGPSGGTPEGRQEFTEDSRSQLYRLKNIVDDLLTLSRLEGGITRIKRSEVDLMELITVSRRLAEQSVPVKKISWHTDGHGSFPIHCDGEKMISVLTNIFRNSLQVLSEGGSILCEINRHDTAITVDIIDTGTGIPMEDLPHIFDRFFRSRSNTAEGSGLGLSIARSIVEAHGGTIEACSPSGRGTAEKPGTLMRIRLPEENPPPS